MTLFALRLGASRGPVYRPFISIAATAWSLADLMTALLLISQFRVNGRRFLTVIASAYLISGLTTWAYIFEFPGLNVSVTASSADQQLSAWFWAVWHTTFPLLVIVTTVLDPDLRERAGTNRAIARTLGTAIMLSITFSVVTVGAMLAFKTHLPKLVDGGHLTATFSHIVARGSGIERRMLHRAGTTRTKSDRAPALVAGRGRRRDAGQLSQRVRAIPFLVRLVYW